MMCKNNMNNITMSLYGDEQSRKAELNFLMPEGSPAGVDFADADVEEPMVDEEEWVDFADADVEEPDWFECPDCGGCCTLNARTRVMSCTECEYAVRDPMVEVERAKRAIEARHAAERETKRQVAEWIAEEEAATKVESEYETDSDSEVDFVPLIGTWKAPQTKKDAPDADPTPAEAAAMQKKAEEKRARKQKKAEEKQKRRAARAARRKARAESKEPKDKEPKDKEPKKSKEPKEEWTKVEKSKKAAAKAARKAEEAAVLKQVRRAEAEEAARKAKAKVEAEVAQMQKLVHARRGTRSTVYSSMCMFPLMGYVCRNGSNCPFAHKFEELNVIRCKYPAGKCRRRGDCRHMHADETKEEYYLRKTGYKAHTGKLKPTPPTRLCRSVTNNTKCYHKVCNFAHHPDEMLKQLCTYGKWCKNDNCTREHFMEDAEVKRVRK